MKLLGWIFTLLGSGSLITTLILRDSSRYRLDKLARDFSELSNDFVSSFINVEQFIALDKGYCTTVDIAFYISVGVSILGIVFLIVSYSKNA